MKYTANIYQLSKDGNETTFSYMKKGETEKEVDINEVADYLAHKLMLLKDLQDERKAKGRSKIGLAITKPLYFFFEIEGKEIICSEEIESIKIKILAKDATKEDIAFDLLSIMRVVNDEYSFELV